MGEAKEGPVSHGELQEMLDQGKIDSSTRIWTQSFEDWLPISEVEHFNMASLDVTPTITIDKKVDYERETDQDYVRPRPWVRFWARMVDYSLFVLILSFFIGFFGLHLGYVGSFSGMVAIFFWVFVEALLIGTVGTTPGKWLLRVVVRDENHHKLSLSESLNRSFSVWWLGMGAGLPIVSLITMLVAAVKLNSSGMTSWDRRSKFKVFHGKVGLARTLVVILYFLCYGWLLAWGQMQVVNQYQ